jgi:hypothetical protein
MRNPLESMPAFAFCPTPIRRSKWLHHFQVHSPKLGRRLSLYSRQAVDFWAMLEGYPQIIDFCELPGLIVVDGGARIADFVLRRTTGDEFIVLGSRSLTAIEHTALTLLDPLPIVRISNEALRAHQQEIDNWLQIVPYLTSNARFLRPEFLSQIEDGLSVAKLLAAIERDALPVDPMLTRTAVFELTRCGRLTSADLASSPLGPRTRFVRAERGEPAPHG